MWWLLLPLKESTLLILIIITVGTVLVRGARLHTLRCIRIRQPHKFWFLLVQFTLYIQDVIIRPSSIDFTNWWVFIFLSVIFTVDGLCPIEKFCKIWEAWLLLLLWVCVLGKGQGHLSHVWSFTLLVAVSVTGRLFVRRSLGFDFWNGYYLSWGDSQFWKVFL